MTKKHKRRFEEYDKDFQRSSETRGPEGVGKLADLKKPSPHNGSLLGAATSALAERDAAQETVPDRAQEWQTVSPNRRSKFRRRRARDTTGRIKYPELSYRAKVTASIRVADLQALALYTIGDGLAPSWIAFKHAHHTRKVVVLMVPGLEKGMFDGHMPIEKGAVRKPGTYPAGRYEEMESQEEQTRKKQQNDIHGGMHAGAASANEAGNPINLDETLVQESLLPLVDIFDDMWLVNAPGDRRFSKLHSPIRAMLFSAIPHSKEHKALKGPKPPAEERNWQPLRTPITHFVLSLEELRDAEYPLHPAAFDGDVEAASLEQQLRDKAGQTSEGGWVDSCVSSCRDYILPDAMIENGSVTAGCKVYALDCEMVLTADDKSSLARISLIDWDGKIVLDELVKPNLPIKNYFTQFSGMTSAILNPVQTTLSDIQVQLLDLFAPQTILLGHSLESDLAALKLTHPFIVDTSLLYPHPRGPPLRLSLKHLAQRYLRRDIQQHDSNGHDSVEDALAVLDLVKLKCEKGPTWGTVEATGESVFRRLARNKRKDTSGVDRQVTSAMIDYGNPERGYGKEATVQIGCESDEEIVSAVGRAVNGDSDGRLVPTGGVDFVWGRLRGLESFRGWCNNNRDCGTVHESHKGQPSPTPSHRSAVDEQARSPAAPPALKQDIDLKDTTQPAGDAGAASQPERRPFEDKRPSRTPENPSLQSKVFSTASKIRAIHDLLPSCTLFIVYTGTGDPREVVRLQVMQQRFRRDFKVKKWDDLSTTWTDDEEQALRRAVEKAREGIGFICVT